MGGGKCMVMNKLHIASQKILRLFFLTFVLLFGVNVALGQNAVLLNPHGDGDSHWKENGTANCEYLKARFSYLCPLSLYAYNYNGMNYASSKHMRSLQRISKAEGVADIAANNYVRKTCLSISYDKDWVEPNVAEDNIEAGAEAIIYAYSKGNETDGYDIYYYISDNDPNTNDDEIYAVFQPNSDARNLFQNGNIKANGENKYPLLETVDLSGWDFSNVTCLNAFFSNCGRLENLTFGATVNLSNLTSAYQMFDKCPENKVKTYFSDFISTWVVDVEWDDENKEFVRTNKFSNGNTVLLTNKSGKQIENNIVTTKNDIEFKITKQGNNCALINQDRPIGEFTSKISSAWIDTISDEIYISWDILYEQKIKKFVLEYSIDGGETYYEIDEIAANSQNDAAYVVAGYSYNWENIPLDFLRAKEYKIRIKMLTTEDNEIDEAFLLPIELTYFEVLQNGNDLFFEWETATETNNDFFTIEQSIDGVSFYEVARIAGAGTSSVSNLYDYTLSTSLNGLVYFRLKQTDYNGDYSYSNVIPVAISNKASICLYPTIASDYITIDGEYEYVEFCDEKGVIQHPHRAEGNTYPISSLPNGMHYAIISLRNGEIVTRQFFKNK